MKNLKRYLLGGFGGTLAAAALAFAYTTTSNMSLKVPATGDSDYPTSISDSFTLIDAHDHTSGKGVQIPAGGLATNSVTTAKIVDSNVTTAKIADSNVTTAKIADSNVTTAKIADSNVTTAKIADGSITQAKRAALTYQTASIAANGSLGVGGSATLGSVTLTTTGRPVLILFAATGAPANPWLIAGSQSISFLIDRDGTDIGKHYSFAVAQSGLFVFDAAPTAASHTYTFRVTNGLGTNTYSANGLLVAIEL